MIRSALGGIAAAGATTLGLCVHDRHRCPEVASRDDIREYSSKVDLFLNPPWHIVAGVTITVGLVDRVVRTLLSTPGRTFSVAVDEEFENLEHIIRSCRAREKPLLVASNHNTFMDAPVLNPMVGRATAAVIRSSASTSPMWGYQLFPWTLEHLAWPYSAAAATVLFTKPSLGTICSLLCGLPLQQKWVKRGEPAPESLFAANTSQHIPGLLRCLKLGRTLVYFPEGRLVQDHVEPRDSDGCWTSHDGRKSEPAARVAPFFNGIGRLVAYSGGIVLPCAHWGLDDILRAGEDGTYSFESTQLHVVGPAHVGIHFGTPLDFGDRLAAFEKANPHLTKFSDGLEASVASGDYLGPEKRALYREITEEIRSEVLRCHSLAARQAARARIGK